MAEAPLRAAFVFPGAGVPCCGAEVELFSRHEAFLAPFLEEASRRAGIDFATALANGAVDATPDRERQLFTYAFGAGLAELLCSRGIEPALTAGYSFGVYGALFGAGAISFEQGFDLLERAYAVMAEETASTDAGMGVVVGLEEEEMRTVLCDPAFFELVLANSSGDTCHVLSGPKPALALALEAALRAGALSAKTLPLSIPYHHPAILGRASSRLRPFLDGVALCTPRCPIISSIDQRALLGAAEIRDFVASNLSTPIAWVRVVAKLSALGATSAIECGPGISLSQNARFIEGALPHVSVRNARGKIGL
jgi:[acyl-carrier-protein] S-malonyltransferase